jgi:hypothetical protein
MCTHVSLSHTCVLVVLSELKKLCAAAPPALASSSSSYPASPRSPPKTPKSASVTQTPRTPGATPGTPQSTPRATGVLDPHAPALLQRVQTRPTSATADNDAGDDSARTVSVPSPGQGLVKSGQDKDKGLVKSSHETQQHKVMSCLMKFAEQ